MRGSSGGLTGRDVVSSGLLERELGGKWGAYVRLISSQVLLTCPPKVQQRCGGAETVCEG